MKNNLGISDIDIPQSIQGHALQHEADLCIRCGSQMVHVGFKIYRCQNCGHEEKPEDVV